MKKSLLNCLALPATAVAFSLFCLPGVCRGDVLAASGSNAIVLDSANSAQGGFTPNTISLGAIAALDLTGVSQFHQAFLFNSGYDGIGGPLPFSFYETIAVNGDSANYTFSGMFTVSPTTDPDMFLLDAGIPMTIGGYTLSSETLTFLDSPPYPGGMNTGVVTFDVSPAAAPEPSSLLLLGSGLAGLAGFFQRRLAR